MQTSLRDLKGINLGLEKKEKSLKVLILEEDLVVDD